MVGKATPDRGGPRKPPMEWTPTSGEQERQRDRHNSGVKILQFMFGLQLPLTCNPWTTFRNLTNKVRGKILLKKYYCVFHYCIFIPASVFVTASLSLCRELFYIYMCMYVDVNLHMWLYNTGDHGSIPCHVIPKTLKMVLDASLLNTQQYKVCIKGKVEQSRENG